MHRIFAFLIGAILAVAVGTWILTRFTFTRDLIYGVPSKNSGLFQP